MLIKLRKTAAAVAAASVCAASVCAAAPADENDKAINYVLNEGIIQGDESGELHAGEYVTRAEAAKMLIKTYGLDESEHKSQNTFSDVSPEDWEYDFVETAAERGLINGFDDGCFRPGDNITYEQAIKMFLGGGLYSSPVYPDDYVSAAIDYDLISGIDAVIGEKMTRAEMMRLIYNFSEFADNCGDAFYPYYAGLSLMINGGDSYSDYGHIYGASIGGAGGASADSAPAEAPLPNTAPSVSNNKDFAVTEEASSQESASLYSSGSSSAAARDGGGYSLNRNPYYNSESYDAQDENIFKSAALSPLSTFSIDTDTASYSNMRRFILNAQPLRAGAIRSEELINYFDYDLPQPDDGTPFCVVSEVSKCPWNSENSLAMISVQGEELTERAEQNLVLLIDVSGSMYSYNKLPLVKRSMELLLDRLDERDTVSIVTYASGTNVVLSGANASEKDKILDAIASLRAGGSTNGAGGIQLAYEQAEKFKSDGNNRVILCTDGDFNVGISDNAELKDFISEKRSNGIFLSILGFGMGNYKDDKMEILADNGDGNYYYIDNLREAKKVFSDEMTSTLYTIAKDVKIQVEFNPVTVESYRLVGYENRRLETEDFENDRVDAGELGAGASVTVFYEIVPAKNGSSKTGDDSLRYQTSAYSGSDELMDVKLRYKLPDGDESILKEYPVSGGLSSEPSENFRFAAAVAELGMIFNDSEYKGSSTYNSVTELARGAMGEDKFGIRHEFVQLVDLLRYTKREPIFYED